MEEKTKRKSHELNKKKWKPSVLIVSGGGVKGYQLPGFFMTAERFNFLKNVKTIGGTSIGAIVLSMWCLGYTGEEMMKIFLEIDLSKFLDEMKTSNFLQYGWFSDGKWLDRLMSKYIKEKYGKEDITLKELYTFSGKKFIINSTLRLKKSKSQKSNNTPLERLRNSLKKNALEKNALEKSKSSKNIRVVYFDHENFPNLSLKKVIMKTVCIPGLFKPLEFEYEGEIYECYDGGLIDNYFIHKFDPKDVLGIYLGKHESINHEEAVSSIIDKDITNVDLFPLYGIKNTTNILWDMINKIWLELETLRKDNRNYKELYLYYNGVTALSFNISDSKKYELVLHGLKESLKFIVDCYI